MISGEVLRLVGVRRYAIGDSKSGGEAQEAQKYCELGLSSRSRGPRAAKGRASR